MLRKRAAVIFLWIALVAGFAFGIALLFQWRFQAGDIYPPYSTFRSDPLGTKVLFESFHRLPGVESKRHLRAWEQLPEGTGSTLFILGLAPGASSDLNREALDRFLREGGRVVLAFRPVQMEPRRAFLMRDEEGEFRPKRGESSNARRLIWRAAWDFEIGYEPFPRPVDPQKPGVAHLAENKPDLPEEISLRTALYFAQAGASWEVLYEREAGRAVLMERGLGLGSLVVLADSYPLSNEAMREERHPGLLVWLSGERENLLFAEAHLGVGEEPGIAALVRKYRLHGFLASVIFLAALFIWKNATSLVPKAEEERDSLTVAGNDSAAGFLNLLQRGIPRRALLRVCMDEWKKSLPHDPIGQRKLQPAETLFKEESETASRNPVETYRKLSRIIAARKQS